MCFTFNPKRRVEGRRDRWKDVWMNTQVERLSRKRDKDNSWRSTIKIFTKDRTIHHFSVNNTDMLETYHARHVKCQTNPSLTGMRKRIHTCASLEARAETKDRGNRERRLESYVVGSDNRAYREAVDRTVEEESMPRR